MMKVVMLMEVSGDGGSDGGGGGEGSDGNCANSPMYAEPNIPNARNYSDISGLL